MTKVRSNSTFPIEIYERLSADQAMCWIGNPIANSSSDKVIADAGHTDPNMRRSNDAEGHEQLSSMRAAAVEEHVAPAATPEV